MDDNDEKPSAQGARVRLGHNPSSSEVSPETALEWEKLRLERQKYALEARLKRREIQDKNGKNPWKDLLTNPVMIAIVGGIITIFTAVITFYFNASESRQAEAAKARLAQESTKETLQADLIKKFVESPRTETVRENLRFLVDAGLIPSYAENIKRYLDSNRGVAPQIGGGIEFLPTGVSVADDIKVQLQKLVKQFTLYLQQLGFGSLDEDISVSIYSKEKSPEGGDYGVDAFYSNDGRIRERWSDDLFPVQPAKPESGEPRAGQPSFVDHRPRCVGPDGRCVGLRGAGPRSGGMPPQ